MIKWLKELYKRLLYHKQTYDQEPNSVQASRNEWACPGIHFKSLSIMTKTPSNGSIGKEDFIAVIYEKKPFWALFQCPCGCEKVISLSLQTTHSPHWTVKKSIAGRPTLHPSVWQNKGCLCHFWIEDGRIHWCKNSGIEPWIAEPNYYSKPR